MATAGTNGTVKSITTTGTGSAVVVSYPADPGPPPVAAHDETYDPCPEPYLGELKRVQNDVTGALKVNCSVTTAGVINGTSVHK